MLLPPTSDLRLLSGTRFTRHDTFKPEAGPERSLEPRQISVEASGHCSACHAPRNLAGSEKPQNAGSNDQGLVLPRRWKGLKPQVAAGRQTRCLPISGNGHSDLAAASGPIGRGASSLVSVPDSDVRAMATYLASLAGIHTTGPYRGACQADIAPSRASGSMKVPAPSARTCHCRTFTPHWFRWSVPRFFGHLYRMRFTRL